MLDTPDIESDRYYEVMQKVRMLPNPKTLEQPIQYWAKSMMPAVLGEG